MLLIHLVEGQDVPVDVIVPRATTVTPHTSALDWRVDTVPVDKQRDTE